MIHSTIHEAVKIYQRSSTHNKFEIDNTSIQKSTRSISRENSIDGEWISFPTFHDTRKALGQSLAGTDQVPGEPVCDWSVNHIGEWIFQDNKKHLREALEFGVGFVVYPAKKDQNAFLVSKRDKNSGKIISAAVIVEYDPKKQNTLRSKIVQGWREFRALCVLMTQSDGGVPELFSNKKYKSEFAHFEEKWTQIDHCIKKWHIQEGPNEIHWYVATVGVVPDFNGKGMGRDLMEQVGVLADKVGVKCYLECGVTKQGFYEKMGYRVLTKKVIEDPVDKKRDPLELVLMIRDPSSVSPPRDAAPRQ